MKSANARCRSFFRYAALKILDGAAVLAFGVIGGAAVEERQCVVRIKPDRFVAICKGLLAFLLSVPLGATIVKKGSKLTAAISTGINRTCARGYCLARRLSTRIVSSAAADVATNQTVDVKARAASAPRSDHGVEPLIELTCFHDGRAR